MNKKAICLSVFIFLLAGSFSYAQECSGLLDSPECEYSVSGDFNISADKIRTVLKGTDYEWEREAYPDEDVVLVFDKSGGMLIFSGKSFDRLNKVSYKLPLNNADAAKESAARAELLALFGLGGESAAITKAAAQDRYIFTRLLKARPALKQGQELKKIVNIRLGEALTIAPSEKYEYIGTYGMGPCVGAAVVAKKDGKVQNVWLAHITPGSDISYMRRTLGPAIQDSDELRISLVSMMNTANAINILREIYNMPGVKNKTVTLENNLFDSESNISVAVNAKTGDVYTGVPVKAFGEPKDFDGRRFYSFPSKFK